jgi:hypothetical protein
MNSGSTKRRTAKQKSPETMPVLAPPAIDLNGRVSLTLIEVARVHAVSPRTAWGWYDQGILKGRKIGQVLRFDIEHVRALFQPER